MIHARVEKKDPEAIFYLGNEYVYSGIQSLVQLIHFSTLAFCMTVEKESKRIGQRRFSTAKRRQSKGMFRADTILEFMREIRETATAL